MSNATPFQHDLPDFEANYAEMFAKTLSFIAHIAQQLSTICAAHLETNNLAAMNSE
jgi:hypothetical protein